jgi:uncharacterized protein (DUF2267 family)
VKNTIHLFAESASQGQRWLQEISESLGGKVDDDYALRALRGVLHALRDQLTVEQSAHLSAQLPVVVRGIFYEEWSPASVPVRDRNEERFLARVSRYFQDKERTVDPVDVVRAVFTVLHCHISSGESEKVYHVLPSEIKKLWPAHSVFGEFQS